MAAHNKTTTPKKPKNPLLTGADLGFPFDNLCGSAILMPIAHEETTLPANVSNAPAPCFLPPDPTPTAPPPPSAPPAPHSTLAITPLFNLFKQVLSGVTDATPDNNAQQQSPNNNITQQHPNETVTHPSNDNILQPPNNNPINFVPLYTPPMTSTVQPSIYDNSGGATNLYTNMEPVSLYKQPESSSYFTPIKDSRPQSAASSTQPESSRPDSAASNTIPPPMYNASAFTETVKPPPVGGSNIFRQVKSTRRYAVGTVPTAQASSFPEPNLYNPVAPTQNNMISPPTISFTSSGKPFLSRTQSNFSPDTQQIRPAALSSPGIPASISASQPCSTSDITQPDLPMTNDDIASLMKQFGEQPTTDFNDIPDDILQILRERNVPYVPDEWRCDDDEDMSPIPIPSQKGPSCLVISFSGTETRITQSPAASHQPGTTLQHTLVTESTSQNPTDYISPPQLFNPSTFDQVKMPTTQQSENNNAPIRNVAPIQLFNPASNQNIYASADLSVSEKIPEKKNNTPQKMFNHSSFSQENMNENSFQTSEFSQNVSSPEMFNVSSLDNFSVSENTLSSKENAFVPGNLNENQSISPPQMFNPNVFERSECTGHSNENQNSYQSQMFTPSKCEDSSTTENHDIISPPQMYNPGSYATDHARTEDVNKQDASDVTDIPLQSETSGTIPPQNVATSEQVTHTDESAVPKDGTMGEARPSSAAAYFARVSPASYFTDSKAAEFFNQSPNQTSSANVSPAMYFNQPGTASFTQSPVSNEQQTTIKAPLATYFDQPPIPSMDSQSPDKKTNTTTTAPAKFFNQPPGVSMSLQTQSSVDKMDPNTASAVQCNQPPSAALDSFTQNPNIRASPASYFSSIEPKDAFSVVPNQPNQSSPATFFTKSRDSTPVIPDQSQQVPFFSEPNPVNFFNQPVPAVQPTAFNTQAPSPASYFTPVSNPQQTSSVAAYFSPPDYSQQERSESRGTSCISATASTDLGEYMNQDSISVQSFDMGGGHDTPTQLPANYFSPTEKQNEYTNMHQQLQQNTPPVPLFDASSYQGQKAPPSIPDSTSQINQNKTGMFAAPSYHDQNTALPPASIPVSSTQINPQQNTQVPLFTASAFQNQQQPPPTIPVNASPVPLFSTSNYQPFEDNTSPPSIPVSVSQINPKHPPVHNPYSKPSIFTPQTSSFAPTSESFDSPPPPPKAAMSGGGNSYRLGSRPQYAPPPGLGTSVSAIATLAASMAMSTPLPVPGTEPHNDPPYNPLPSIVTSAPGVSSAAELFRPGSVPTECSAATYRPVYHHWFYKREIEGRPIWIPFSMSDSMELDKVFVSGDKQKIVATDGGRYDVNVAKRLREPVYWSQPPNEVRRCSWFYKGALDSRSQPYEEAFAEKLEEEYRSAFISNRWPRRVELSYGEAILLNGPINMMHLPPTSGSILEDWGSIQDQGTKPRNVKRGCDEFDIDEGEPAKPDHLLFLVHGIGSVCDLKFRSVVEVVDDFRSLALTLVRSHFRQAGDEGLVTRVEVLPVSWHGALHGEETGIDKQLQGITLKSIPRLRHFTNDTLLDILFYTSPVYCQTIIRTVGHELNRLQQLFMKRNPDFTGGISLGGHSLGSLILFDLLCHQRPAPKQRRPSPPRDPLIFQGDLEVEEEEDEFGEPIPPPRNLVRRESCRVDYMMGPAGTGQPSISYPQLHFNPSTFFALGSPVAMFVTVRGIESLGKEFCLPTCPGFFNIFHPFDPVAYRIESLINPELSKLKPVVVPHHKGRKRMHIELRETMARVGTDLKERLVDSVRSTWNTVYQLAMFNRGETLEQEVDKVLAEQMLAQEAMVEEATSDSLNDWVDPDVALLGQLNSGRRVDYVLQEAPLESFNEYLFALGSHVCYWESEDTMLLMLREIYTNLGVTPDRQFDRSREGSVVREGRFDSSGRERSWSAGSKGSASPTSRLLSTASRPTPPLCTPPDLSVPPPTSGFIRKQ